MKNILENSKHVEGEFGANLLHYAVRNGNVQILQFLIIKCRLNPFQRSMENGFLPTHEAASLGNVETLAWLLKMTNLSLLERDHYGHTYLHIAARYEYLLSPISIPHPPYHFNFQQNFHFSQLELALCVSVFSFDILFPSSINYLFVNRLLLHFLFCTPGPANFRYSQKYPFLFVSLNKLNFQKNKKNLCPDIFLG